MINLATDLLRTFVSIVDLGSYTRAANHHGRTQPAISLQVKRLEDLLGVTLLDRSARGIVLTEAGQTMIVYARQILQLNDDAVAKFADVTPSGLLRIGLPTDFAVEFLQDVLIDFRREHGEVELEIHCDLSRRILDLLLDDQLDIAVALTTRDSQYLVREWREQPIWAAAAEFDAGPQTPVPLVTHPEGCEYRSRMISALSNVGTAWRISYTDPAIAGVQRAVLAGIGVSALTQKTLLPGMKMLRLEDGFPPLADIRIGLFYKHSRMSDAGLLVVNQLMAGLQDDADVSP